MEKRIGKYMVGLILVVLFPCPVLSDEGEWKIYERFDQEIAFSYNDSGSIVVISGLVSLPDSKPDIDPKVRYGSSGFPAVLWKHGSSSPVLNLRKADGPGTWGDIFQYSETDGAMEYDFAFDGYDNVWFYVVEGNSVTLYKEEANDAGLISFDLSDFVTGELISVTIGKDSNEGVVIVIWSRNKHDSVAIIPTVGLVPITRPKQQKVVYATESEESINGVLVERKSFQIGTSPKIYLFDTNTVVAWLEEPMAQRDQIIKAGIFDYDEEGEYHFRSLPANQGASIDTIIKTFQNAE